LAFISIGNGDICKFMPSVGVWAYNSEVKRLEKSSADAKSASIILFNII
jgi:hypothetical protein